MATNLEIRMMQRNQLFDLLILREHNKDITVNRLDELIMATEAMMDEEDVAWVEKKIAQLFSK